MRCRARVRLLALVAAGSACAPSPDEARAPDAAAPDATACVVDDCAPYGCDPRDGACRHFCAGEAMCASGFVCQDGACVGTECTVETAAAVCGAYACVNGTCATDCALGPCAAGFYCRGDTSACVPRCQSRGDDGCAGYLCDLDVGECESYCLDGELGCAAGFACDAGNQCTEDVSAAPCAAGCGAYACLESLGRCATHCVEDGDCAAGATCSGAICA